ncbi:MAG: hypothetical protein AMXMBFR13_45310 [Phycisphaerae bacterium]
MSPQTEREVAQTRQKLEKLESDYRTLSSEASEDEELREMTLESLQRLINQLKEEIARYEARHAVRG